MTKKIDDLELILTALTSGGRVSVDLAKARLLDRLRGALADPEKRPRVPTRVWDTKVPALCLRVMPTGVMSFYVHWSHRGVRSLGKFPTVTITGARLQAQEDIATANKASDGIPAAVKVKQAARERGTAVVRTVKDVCAAYAKGLRDDKRDTAAKDVEGRFARTIDNDPLGRVRLVDLHQDHIVAWRKRLETGKLAPLPAKRGRSPKIKPMTPPAFKRNLAALKAALNYGVQKRYITDVTKAGEWGRVKPEQDADGSRELTLDRAQRRALVAAAAGAVRDLIEFVALTGCRAGDPAAMVRQDFDAAAGTVRLTTKVKPSSVALSPDAKALLTRLAADKIGRARMFVRDDEKAWTPAEWSAAVREAAAKAGLPEGVTLYTLRHSWITDALVGGMDPLTVAKQARTSLKMIDKTYGKLLMAPAAEKLAQIPML